jgi:hypothetical protein
LHSLYPLFSSSILLSVSCSIYIFSTYHILHVLLLPLKILLFLLFIVLMFVFSYSSFPSFYPSFLFLTPHISTPISSVSESVTVRNLRRTTQECLYQ